MPCLPCVRRAHRVRSGSRHRFGQVIAAGSMYGMDHAPVPLKPEDLRDRAGQVCVALSGAAMLADAERSLSRSRFFEFRLDSVADPRDALPGIISFLAEHREAVAIATCRRTRFGGSFDGTASQQVDLLLGAARSGCRLVDIEVETAEELGPDVLRQMRAAGAAVIGSWHDFSATPDLEAVRDRIGRFAPDFAKIVPTAQSLRDALRIIDLLERHGEDGRLIAMSMGQKGVLTRVLGLRFGSAFTFAAPDSGSETAPGQIAVHALRDLYRIESITASTAIYAVAGEPIGASLSPLMHNTAFAAEGMDAVYLPLETASADELQEVIERLGIRGLSITMPLKEAVLPLVSHKDPAVDQMDGCNTLMRRADGSWKGFNTDRKGITGPLERRLTLRGKRVLVLGAGGAARAAVFGLRDAGAEVFLLNRTVNRAKALAREAGAQVQPRETLQTSHFDIIINSTPYGMRGKESSAPILENEMDCALFFDLVYNPVQTPLMRMAAAKHIATIPGAEMFVAQGVRQFEIWTGRPAPEEAMLRAVEQALAART